MYVYDMDTGIIIATIIPTLVVTLGGIFYKSKCTNVKLLWGCLSFDRNVDDETQIDMNEGSHPKP